MIARRLVIAGRVQGVFYRQWLIGEATRLGVAGWVRNRPDGGVEAVAEGARDAVEALIALARRGPPAARVDDVAVDDIAPLNHPGFVRRATGWSPSGNSWKSEFRGTATD